MVLSDISFCRLTLYETDMDREKFERAKELEKQIDELVSHKVALEASKINYGGSLIFHYNDHHKDVRLMPDFYGNDDFFASYMDALNRQIRRLEKDFEEL